MLSTFSKQVQVFVASLSCKPQVEPTPEVKPTPELEGGKLQESVATQKRINRYFQSEVMPKLKTCWERVQGEGTIEMIFRYENNTRADGHLRRSKLENDTEGRPPPPWRAWDAVAAPRSKRASDTAESYLIDWVWLFYAADAEQQIARMFGLAEGEGGGCDGHGRPQSV
jgi:hypothetical protein